MKKIPKHAKFAAIRKHDIHTGIDIYQPEGSPVYAIEDGEVMAVAPFTGPQAESPWWNPTDYVGVLGASGYIVYGEISPCVKPGDLIRRKEEIGKVKRVLKKDKGLPTSMLHLEYFHNWFKKLNVDEKLIFKL